MSRELSPMQHSAVPLSRWLRATIVTSIPLAVTFIILIGLGLVPPLAGGLSLAGLTLVAALLIRLAIANLDAIRVFGEAMARDGPSETAPALSGPAARAAGASLHKAARQWHERFARLEADRMELGRALDALPDPLMVLGAERKVMRANRAALALLGEELVGRDISASLRNPGLLLAIEHAMAGKDAGDVEFTLPSPVERTFTTRIERLPEQKLEDGSEPGGEGGARPGREGGKVLGREGGKVLLALVDLTAIRRTEQMRADFVANASHEIRTPLATLIGFIETLRGAAKDDAEARARFLTIMDQHAQRMARLVDDLLSLSRIEMNEHARPTGRVAIGPILATVRSNLSWQAKAREATIVVDTEPYLPDAVGESDELTQVFLNLVDNAIKYGGPDSAVTIRARLVAEAPGTVGWRVDSDGAIAVAVIDHGEGIAREHLPRLTERFYRIDTARSRELGGTGLGLAIVKHIVNRHRGAFAIDSTPGAGSTFTVYLQPAVEAAKAAPGSDAAAPPDAA